MSQELQKLIDETALAQLMQAYEQYKQTKISMNEALTDRGIGDEWKKKSNDRLKLSFADSIINILNYREEARRTLENAKESK